MLSRHSPARTNRVFREGASSRESFPLSRANESMASAAFFLLSNLLTDNRVGRSLQVRFQFQLYPIVTTRLYARQYACDVSIA